MITKGMWKPISELPDDDQRRCLIVFAPEYWDSVSEEPDDDEEVWEILVHYIKGNDLSPCLTDPTYFIEIDIPDDHRAAEKHTW